MTDIDTKTVVLSIHEQLEVNNDDQFCSVCLQNFKDDYVTLDCHTKHRFHKSCIDAWFKSKRECPMCRAECTGYNVIKRIDFNQLHLNYNQYQIACFLGVAYTPGTPDVGADDIQYKIMWRPQDLRIGDVSCQWMSFKDIDKKIDSKGLQSFHRTFQLPPISEIVTNHEPFKFEMQEPRWEIIDGHYYYLCSDLNCTRIKQTRNRLDVLKHIYNCHTNQKGLKNTNICDKCAVPHAFSSTGNLKKHLKRKFGAVQSDHDSYST